MTTYRLLTALGMLTYVVICGVAASHLTFYWDDHFFILTQLDRGLTGALMTGINGHWWPLATLILYVETQIFGFWYPGYIIVNAVIVVATSILAFTLLESRFTRHRWLLKVGLVIYVTSFGVVVNILVITTSWPLSVALAILTALLISRGYRTRIWGIALAACFLSGSGLFFVNAVSIAALVIVIGADTGPLPWYRKWSELRRSLVIVALGAVGTLVGRAISSVDPINYYAMSQAGVDSRGFQLNTLLDAARAAFELHDRMDGLADRARITSRSNGHAMAHDSGHDVRGFGRGGDRRNPDHALQTLPTGRSLVVRHMQSWHVSPSSAPGAPRGRGPHPRTCARKLPVCPPILATLAHSCDRILGTVAETDCRACPAPLGHTRPSDPVCSVSFDWSLCTALDTAQCRRRRQTALGRNSQSTRAGACMPQRPRVAAGPRCCAGSLAAQLLPSGDLPPRGLPRRASEPPQVAGPPTEPTPVLVNSVRLSHTGSRPPCEPRNRRHLDRADWARQDVLALPRVRRG